MMNTLEQKIYEVIARAVDNHEAAGYNVLIRKDGEQIAYAEAGYANIAEKKPIARDSIFRLYSQSKPITSAAVMILIQRGLLDLFDPIETFLPGFADAKVVQADGTIKPAARGVNVQDLLNMQAGLAYPDADRAGQYVAELFIKNQELIAQGGGMTTVELANAMGALPLTFEPGSSFRYSTCADILGAVVEVVSGKPFAQFLKDELFEPLGMEDTGFWVPAEKQDRFVTAYKRVDGGLTEYHQQHLCVGIYDREPAFASGGAGLVSTLDDYARFAEMLLRGGELDGERILHPATVAWMTKPQLLLDNFWGSLPGHGYGKLMRVCVDPGRAPGIARLGEYGWDGWLGTYFANFPAEHLTIQLCQNTTDAGTTACTRKVRNLVLAATL